MGLVKSTDCLLEDTHIYEDLQPSVTVAPGHLMPSSDPFGHQAKSGIQTYMLAKQEYT